MSAEHRDAELDELLGAYALDAVDEEEREAVQAYLRASPRARAEVAEHREVAALLAGGGSPAPHGLWERIATSIDGPMPTRPVPLVATPRDGTSERPAPRAGGTTATRPRRWLLAVGAAAAAAVIVVLGAVVVRQGRQIDRIEDDLAAAVDAERSVDLEAAAGRASLDPANRTVDLAGEAAASIVAVLEPDGSGYLLAGDLEPLPEGQTYQLWGLRDDVPVSLGVLGPQPGVVAFEAEGPFDALAVSVEQAGGAVTPSTPQLSGAIS